MNRSLNVKLIDMAILKHGWSRTEAATRLGMNYHTLQKILAGTNVTNDVIFRLHEGFKRAGVVDIKLEDLVVWAADEKGGSINGDAVPQK